MGNLIEKKLTEAGFKMLGDNSIQKLILHILNSENIRYLKAIPFLIYKYKIDFSSLYTTKNKDLLDSIINTTLKIFNEFDIKRNLPKTKLKNKLNYQEFRDEFELQLRNETKPSLFIEKQKIYAERDLQMYLSQLFTKKEKQIIRRLLEEKPISKTDYEYYSRKTKKKLNSIIGLQDFAKSIYAKTPEYDEELYDLKKKMEEWLENDLGDKEIKIEEFFRWEDKISIDYKKKTEIYNQSFNTNIKINKIKDNEILRLLSKYKRHNFR